MVVEYRQSDGSTKMFGYQMSDGPLNAATGQLLQAWHSKCLWVERKREHRGDAVSGRVLSGIPTGYDISTVVISRDEADALGVTEAQNEGRTTRFLSTRLDALRELSRRVGKPVGDPTVTEAFRAEEHGGAYKHSHHHPLGTYQLRAHLFYAHGLMPAVLDRPVIREKGLDALHGHLHAEAAQQSAIQARQTDPGYVEPTDRDWREHAVADIEELT